MDTQSMINKMLGKNTASKTIDVRKLISKDSKSKNKIVVETKTIKEPCGCVFEEFIFDDDSNAYKLRGKPKCEKHEWESKHGNVDGVWDRLGYPIGNGKK